MESGYEKDGEYKRGYKYATITLVGDHAPIALGSESGKEDSAWEPDGSPVVLESRSGELTTGQCRAVRRFGHGDCSTEDST